VAVTAQTFKDAYPEFENLGDTYIETKITSAELLCPDAIWGDFADQGVMLRTAQQLALSPPGRDLKLVSDDGKTVYDAELMRLRTIVSSGNRLI